MLSQADIVGSVKLFEPGLRSFPVADHGPAIEACADADWPAELPPSIAVGIAHAPVTIVNREGATTVTFAGVGCEAPDEDLYGAVAHLRFAEALAGGPGEAADRISGRSYLAVIGATPSPTARLRDPELLAGAAAEPFRTGLRARAPAIAAMYRDRCTRPVTAASPEVMAAAVDATPLFGVRAGENMVAFAQLSHPAITTDCGDGAEAFAVLIDIHGAVLLEIEASARIGLQWVVDLDGDGVDEALVDVHFSEDGGREIGLMQRDDGTWTNLRVWAAETP